MFHRNSPLPDRRTLATRLVYRTANLAQSRNSTELVQSAEPAAAFPATTPDALLSAFLVALPMPASLTIRGVNHLGRPTRRLAESIAFYRDVLGFRLIERPNFNFAGAWLFNYGVQIHLIVSDAAAEPSGEIQTRADHLALFVENIEECKSRLIEHGIPFRENHVPGRNVYQVFFRDPDGNHIELATYPATPEFI